MARLRLSRRIIRNYEVFQTQWSAALEQSPLEAAHRRVLERSRDSRGSRGDAQREGAAMGVAQDGLMDPEMVAWGETEESPKPVCLLVADYGELEAEYAAIRRGTGIIDRADRGLLEVHGADAVDLLSRLITNAMPGEGGTVRGFLLARTGRILGDVLLVVNSEMVLLDLDRTDAELVKEHIESFVFSEDVQVVNRTPERHRIELHGPDAEATFAVAFGDSPPRNWSLAVNGRTPCSEPGLAIDVPRSEVEDVWETLIEAIAPASRPPRAIGWHAYNIARIETGTPIFHVDFGPDALPHETGVLQDRVSFTKGCYPGQEVVARMESRGKSKRQLIGLRIQGEAVPLAGTQVFLPDPDDAGTLGEQVGVLTSSTIAPMLGAAVVGFASIRTAQAADGTTLRVVAEGEPTSATTSSLRFLESTVSDGGVA